MKDVQAERIFNAQQAALNRWMNTKLAMPKARAF